MKFRGGYDICLEGRPSGQIFDLDEPDILYLPLRSRRFTFSAIQVKDQERVRPGQVLAKDPANYSVPLLAPRAGTVKLSAVENHIVLEDITQAEDQPYCPDDHPPHATRDMGSVGRKRYQLLVLGAWQFFADAHTGALPDPFGTPRAVIISVLALEPFEARGNVLLYERLSHFTRGLEHVQSLLEYQPIYLVLPKIHSPFASQVREMIRGYAWVKMIEVPLQYPHDHFASLSRKLGFNHEEGNSVWAIRTEGIFGIDRALTASRPCTERILSMGGPAVKSPRHLKAMPGYPLRAILDSCLSTRPARVIDGGVLTGQVIGNDQLGLDAECTGLTVLPEVTENKFLAFLRPGWDRFSYSRCFLSSLRPRVPERFTTALRGEGRACVACGSCEEVCPAGIMPHLIHKYLYQDEIEEVERVRVDLCVGCGLCSFVCLSKIELTQQLLAAQETIRHELHAEEVEA